MRPKERRDSGQSDLFKARLDQIVDVGHPLAKLAHTIDWRFLRILPPQAAVRPLVADALAQRIGEEKLVALIQESLSVATRTKAAKPSDFSKVIVDTTVQPRRGVPDRRQTDASGARASVAAGEEATA